MSFLRHGKSIIRCSCGRGPVRDRARFHRLDEFPAGYSLTGCAPAVPASASPAESKYAVIWYCRSRSFQRTAYSLLTGCLSRGGRFNSGLRFSGARFDRERRILSLFNHPHIARLLDYGTIDGKVPWLALEYVDGSPITDYCEEKNLTLRDRILVLRAA